MIPTPTPPSFRRVSVDEDLPYNDDECASFLLTLKYAKDAAGIVRSSSPYSSADSSSETSCNSSTTSSSGSSVEEIDTNHHQQQQNYAGVAISPALPSDEHWLSELQCYLRQHCVQIFAATKDDVASRKHGGGRATNIEEGQIGVRCRFCHMLPPHLRATQSSSFPTKLTGLSTSVVMMQCRHFPACTMVPQDVRDQLNWIASTSAAPRVQHSPDDDDDDVATTPATTRWWSRGGSTGKHQYWISSAKKIGLIDTVGGIRFGRDPREDGPSSLDNLDSSDVEGDHCLTSSIITTHTLLPDRRSSEVHQVMEDSSTVATALLKEEQFHDKTSSLSSASSSSSSLVTEEDKSLIPDYLFVAMQQMIPCNLTEEDRVGCYKDRETGFCGIACKHCGGMPGFGKYFPASVRSLAQTTTSQTIVKHVGAKCKRCPPHVRALMVEMQHRARVVSMRNNKSTVVESTSRSKPKYGSRKVFFQRVWGRLHGEHVPDIYHLQEEDDDEEDCKSKRSVSTSSRRKVSVCEVSESDNDAEYEPMDDPRRPSSQRSHKKPRISQDKEFDDLSW